LGADTARREDRSDRGVAVRLRKSLDHSDADKSVHVVMSRSCSGDASVQFRREPSAAMSAQSLGFARKAAPPIETRSLGNGLAVPESARVLCERGLHHAAMGDVGPEKLNGPPVFSRTFAASTLLFSRSDSAARWDTSRFADRCALPQYALLPGAMPPSMWRDLLPDGSSGFVLPPAFVHDSGSLPARSAG
jgi:hypothetical protein